MGIDQKPECVNGLLPCGCGSDRVCVRVSANFYQQRFYARAECDACDCRGKYADSTDDRQAARAARDFWNVARMADAEGIAARAQ